MVDWLYDLIGVTPSSEIDLVLTIVASLIVFYMVRYVLMLFGYAVKFFKELK